MDYYAIAPKSHLNLVEELDKHLVVAQMLDDPVIFEFYHQLSKSGADIIIDNGVAEFKKPMADKKYLEVIRALKPTQVVLPDVWKNGTETAWRAADFYYRMEREERKDYKLIGVPHGNTISELIECLGSYISLDIIDIIGLAYKEWYDRTGLSRQFFAKYQCQQYELPVHMLGLWNVKELQYAQPNVKSVDTSMPFRCASRHWSIAPDTLETTRMDFGMELGAARIELVEHNIFTLKVLIENSGGQSGFLSHTLEDK